jgi:hypothetical protein
MHLIGTDFGGRVEEYEELTLEHTKALQKSMTMMGLNYPSLSLHYRIYIQKTATWKLVIYFLLYGSCYVHCYNVSYVRRSVRVLGGMNSILCKR